MNWKLSRAFIFGNLVYYTGLMSLIAIYVVDGSYDRWLIPGLLIGIGLLLSVLPDSAINSGFSGISIGVMRAAFAVKIAELFSIYFLLGKVDMPIFVALITLLIAIQVFLEVVLYRQSNKENVSFNDFLNSKVKNSPKEYDNIIKKMIYILLSMALFTNSQDNILSSMICGILCLVLHISFSETIIHTILKYKKVNKWMMRSVMWLVYITAGLCAVIEMDILCYIFMGFYWMFVTDIALQKATSIIKTKNDNDS